MESSGTLIGPYKLLEAIGEGGMGSVWMAQQTEPVKRLVAVKLIKAGMDSKQVIARFEAERQALALMDHANIAKVLDAGTVGAEPRPKGSAEPHPLPVGRGSARPYFVMELVKGVPITSYCDEHHLTPRQRLELFVPICQAVQHAHQKGIIHRDLKPSNVLVALYDGKPVPKVIDFGVAKAAGQSLTDKTLVTGFGSIVGTLEYMSPEQAEVNQLDIDTRSDIYSLGVLLYELLTGSPPFTRKELEKGGMLEMLRVIREQEPTRPSTKLSTAEGLPTLAANRGTEPAKLTRLVRGELDWMVMKALEKDRSRRYETANAFAMDVQRYLADEQVLACPPSAGYRLRKFARRNRRPVLAASLVFLGLVAGVIGTAWQALRAEQARKAEANRAEGERRAKERAETNFALAKEAVEKYLGTVTDDPDLRRSDFHRLRKKLLESAIPLFQKLTEQKSDDPAVEAGRGQAYQRLADVHWSLGENEAAKKDSEAMQAIFARLSADFPTVPAYRQGLASSCNKLAISLAGTGKFAEAEAALRQALDVQENLVAEFPTVPTYRQDLARSHFNMGRLLWGLGKLQAAAAAVGRALDIQSKLAVDFPNVPEYRHELAISHNRLGILLTDLGKPREAEAAKRQALRIQEKLVTDFPATPAFRRELALNHNSLGLALAARGKHEEAKAAHRQSLDIQEKLATDFPTVPRYRDELASFHINLGALLTDQGKPGEAEAEFRRALDIHGKLNADYPNVPEYRRLLAMGYGNLGTLLTGQGRRLEAEAAYRRSLELYEKLAADFPSVPSHAAELGNVYCNYGTMILDGGQAQRALGWYQKAIARLEPIVAQRPRQPTARLYLCNSHRGRARTLDELGQHGAATRDWKRTLELDNDRMKPIYRLRIHRNSKDAASCLGAAAVNEAWKPPGAVGMYDAACNRAICAAVIREDPKTQKTDAHRLAQEQADLAMAWLHRAIAAGYKNAERLKHDKDLDVLRKREDFKRLLAELQANKE
jgi:serine/threonine protein kinase/Tfp pilus assembly protein PilF